MSNEEPANPPYDFLEKELLKMWRRSLDNEHLTIDDDFFDFGGDSLLATNLLLEIEKLTGKKLSTSLIFETGTVRELLKRVNLLDEQSTLLGCENGKIIHLFHGDFNYGGVPVKHFIKMLGNDHRIHPIPPHLPQEGESLISIEDMAKERLQSIIEMQPDDPYILAGHCNGALVGFEAARLLVSMGKEVKAVVMIDPLIPSVRRSVQVIFKIREFYIWLTGPEGKRRERLVNTWRKMYKWDSKTKDIWRLTHLITVWKKLKEMNCRIFEIPHPIRYIFHRSWRNRLSLLNERNQNHGKRLAEEMPDSGASERILYYCNVLFDYRPHSLDVPVLYVSIEFSGRAWRRICRNTTYVNICRGVHHFWDEDYMPYVFAKIREFIDR